MIFPTDTVVGIGVSTACPEALGTLYAAKGRDEGKPVAWLVGSAGDIELYGRDVRPYACKLARRFWPGGLTLVVKASGGVALEFQSKQGTIGLRMPDSECAQSLIRALGRPIATTSANASGSPAPGSIGQVPESFAPGVMRLAVLVESAPRAASTVIDCTGPAPLLLRAGTIPFSDIEDFLKGETCA